jgi:hypothetical protein
MSDIFSEKTPLIIHHPDGGDRLIAEIFPHEESGIVFFDIFWPVNDSSHFVHIVPGEIKRTHPTYPEWQVGGIPVRALDSDGGDDRYWNEWNQWSLLTKRQEIRDVIQNRDYVHRLAREMGALIV